MALTLAEWRAHIDQVVADEGQWLGVADENGAPLYELAGAGTFPSSFLTAESAEVTVNVAPGDVVVDDLVGERLGVMDAEGRLVPASGPTRLLVWVREGERLAATITHTVASGGLVPSALTIHAVDLLDGLAWWPCPSIPVEWKQAEFKQWDTDESGISYASVRELARVQMTTKLDGYTVSRRARTAVRVVVQDSFDAVNRLMGWSDPHAVVAFDGGEDTTPDVFIRVNDDPVLDTVQETCRQAGLSLRVGLWWPGDAPVQVRTDHDGEATEAVSWPYPVQVVRVDVMEEV
ncbi:hypothetical protein ACUY3H_04325 [Corynebacterium ureicelerivorans]